MDCMIYILFPDNLIGFNNLLTPIAAVLSVLGVLFTVIYSIRQHILNILLNRFQLAENAINDLNQRFNNLTYYCLIKDNKTENGSTDDDLLEIPIPYFGEMAYFKFMIDVNNVKEIHHIDFFYTVAMNNLIYSLITTIHEIIYLNNKICKRIEDENFTKFSLNKIFNFSNHLCKIKKLYFTSDIDRFSEDTAIHTHFENFGILEKSVENLKLWMLLNPTPKPSFFEGLLGKFKSI